MSDPFPITVAQMVALFMECIFYGIYLVTLGYCTRALLCEKDKLVLRRRKDIKWIMVIVALLMATFATLDVAFGLRHNLDAFVYDQGLPGGAAQEFSDITYWVNVMKTADYIAQTAIGDAMLVYRAYVIYNKQWKIIVLPVLLWATTTVCGSGIVWVEMTTKHSALLSESALTPWQDSFFAFTLVVNVFVTSLIVWRLWNIRTRVAHIASHPDKLLRVIRIVLDSGLMYTLSIVILFGTNIAGSNATYGVSDVVVQVIGITFNLIIIRVNAGHISSADAAYASTVIDQNTGGGGPGIIPLRKIGNGIAPAFVNIQTEVNRFTDDGKGCDRSWRHGLSSSCV